MKKNVTVLLLLVFASLMRAQTAPVQNIGNLCFMNYEPIASSAYSVFQTQEMNFDSLHLSANMASYVSNYHMKFFIGQNNGPLTSPSYSYVAYVYYHPDLYEGNSVSGRFNYDNKTDYALINANSDIITLKNTGFPAQFQKDSIPYTFISNHTCSKLLKVELDGTGPSDLVSFGIRSISNPSFVMRPYLNITPTITAANLAFAPLPLRTISPNGSWTNYKFDVEAANLDGTAGDELVFVSEVLDSIYVIYSDGGILNKQLQISTGNTGLVNKKVVLSDLNGDGKKEITVSGKLTTGMNYVCIYSPIVISGSLVGVNPTSTVVANYEFSDYNFADLNADGYKDLIVSQVTATTSNSGVVNVYMHYRSQTQPFQFNNTPIQFTLPNHFTGGIAVCDVDNNKRPDIISFANSQPSSIAILKNFTFRDSLYAIPNKTAFCQGESMALGNQLIGFSGPFFTSITSAIASSHTSQVTSGGTYTASASFTPYVGGTCVFVSNPVNLVQIPMPNITVNTPSSVCYNTNAILTAGGASTFTWNTAAGTSTNSFLSLTPTASIPYSLTGASVDGCKAVLSGTLNVKPDVNAAITPDKNLLCKNQSANLAASGGLFYLWNTGQTTPNIVITQTSTAAQLYSVLVTNSDGCTKSVTFNTNYNDKCKEVIVKTGIVPGDGGENAHLYIENIENYPENVVSVYNRWGKQLYSEKGYDNTTKMWPTKDDRNLMSGTYYYVLELGQGNGVIKGWVEIFSN